MAVSIAIELYRQECKSIDYKVLCVSVNEKLTACYSNGLRDIQKALEVKMVKSSAARAMSQQTTFKAQLFFLYLIFIEDCVV